MKPVRLLFLTAGGALLAGAAHADEGLWTFDNFPAAKVKAALGVDITPAWLDRVRGQTARLSVGCSSSIVGAEGLVLTNDHCATDCVQALSPPDDDYTRQGFLAATKAEERTCPGLRAEVLLQITDVTARVQAAGAGLSGEALVKARDAVSATIEQEGCGAEPKLHCQVVNLYQGGEFKLYRFRKYADVRLVFSPGDRAAFFGGDPDNFSFPRYDLDCAFLRLYENGRPVATPGHLIWNPAPPVAGQPVFTAGNPGGTYRADTVAQLEVERTVRLPVEVAEFSELRGRMIRFGEESPANARMVDEPLMDIENAYKEFLGGLMALNDPDFMAARRAAEGDLQAKAAARLGPAIGDPWADMAAVQRRVRGVYLPYRQLERAGGLSQLFNDARDLVRAAAEREKPSAERLPRYTDSNLAAVEKEVLDPTPIQGPLEQLILEYWLSKTRELLTADDPATRLVLGKDSPETLSAELVAGTKLGDPAFRKALWDGGERAIETSDDPMIRFMRRIDPEARAVRRAYEESIEGPAARAAEAIAKARFTVYGDSLYPDGTFSPRVSYGAIAGWTTGARTVGPFTRFAGLYDRATGQPPFDLDPRWIAARPKLDPDTIFNFVTTNDIIGGNSGSPVLNAKGEVIGAAFDGNLESLGGNYGYDGAVNRTVVVSAAAMTEALQKVYGADALVAELGAK